MTYLILAHPENGVVQPWVVRIPLLGFCRRVGGDGRRFDSRGVVQGWSWAALQRESSVQVSIPFWSVRIVAGLVMFTAQKSCSC
ncbi:MAG: hypothetical protein U0872_00700 [Planctomycetaceae bacterium]